MTVLNPPVRDSNMANVQENVPNNVKVIVRVRPPNDLELHGQGKHVVEIMDENVLVFDPKDQSSPFLGRYGKRQRQDIRKRRQKDLKFAFDYVFGWDSSNSDVFEQTTKTVLDGLLGGYNCSVFAYGATGAGKTHTMLGNESNPGVIYHTMIHLYRHITEMSPEKTCDVAVSYLEVYNEQIRDLLMPRGTLPIREDQNAGVIVPGLSLHKPSTAEELLHMLQFGNKNRTQHPTDANAESSRSHAVFQVFVRQRERTANISAQVKVAKMCLVDLAGSERATLTKNRGIRFREGANINRSLLALGNVINSLADHKYKGHIPYRDSKLTRLLKDSLGGNCRTIMIAAVSPSELSYEDTYNTLKYADRAKNIRLNMKKNVLSVDFHVSQYGKIVEELRREITELKSKLQQCERPAVSYAESLCLPSNLQSLHGSLQAAYSERRALRDQQLRQEITLRHTHWRLYRKHKSLRRASLLTHALPGRVQKIQGEMEGLQRKVVSQETGRQSLCQQLHSNTQDLHALHAKLAGAHNKTSVSSQVLDMSVQKMALEVEVNDSRHYIHHLRRLARAQEQEAMASETLITALLQLVQQQQLELQRCGAQSPDIAADYHSVCDLVGQVGVSWADGEEDQVAFHINSIIDIPLVTSAGVMLNRVRSPGHPTTGSSVHLGVSQGWTNSVSSCPGPVVNGQEVISTHSASLPGSSSHPDPLPSDPGRGHHGTFTVPSTTLSLASSPSLCVSDNHGAASSAPPLNPGAVVTHLSTHQPHPHISSSSSSSTIHAGHTPNAKTLQHQTHSHQGMEVVADPRERHFAHDHRETGSDCILPPPPLPPALNSSFTVHHGVIDMDSQAEEGNSTVVLKRSSQPCLPVVDSEGLLCVGERTGPRESVGAIHADRSMVQSDSRSGGQHGQVSSSAGTVPVSSGQSAHNPQNKCTSNGASKDPAKAQSQGAQHRERPQNENDSSCPSRSSSVRRAINFDAANLGSTPLRVEGKSYADAVRTPTPPRQPLRTLDCNSPQLQAKNLAAGEAQTPKNGGRGSGYIAGPQALDNMRRLKQLGMPSLVENLVIGHKAGVSETSRPGYMQPTKAAARRMRRQPLSKDDCFNPRRVPNKNLAHSRSKSTSQLNRIGWKI